MSKRSHTARSMTNLIDLPFICREGRSRGRSCDDNLDYGWIIYAMEGERRGKVKQNKSEQGR